MRGIRLLVGVLFSLSIGVVGCDVNIGPTPSPTPAVAPDIVASLWPVCDGEPVSGTGALDTSGARINHVVLLDLGDLSGGVEPRYQLESLPAQWAPRTLADTELVACAGEPTREVVEVCPYMGSDITRYLVARDFEVIEASTAETVANFTISAMPRECHSSESASLTVLEGEIDAAMVAGQLTHLVQTGSYLGPDETPGPHDSAKPSSFAQKAELRRALADGLISITGTGDGLQSLDVELTSEVSYDLDVTIEVGTQLEPGARGTQRMVVVAEQTVSLGAGATTSASLDVACMEMHQDQPTADDSFRVLDDPAGNDLLLLLASSDFADASGRVQQFAVWTITNDPKRNDYVGLTSGFSPFGTGPDDEEIAAIRDLFDQAGIDTSKYRALR